jgi:hypothetical protein
VDETRFGRDIAPRCPDAAARRPYHFVYAVGRCCCAAGWLLRQLQPDFETLGELAEKNRIFPGQNSGQPMSHAGQDGIASARGLIFALPKGIMGKHGFGAAGEFGGECFRDGCPKIIARLVEDAPRQIQRAITGLPFKIRDRRVSLCLCRSRRSTLGFRLLLILQFHLELERSGLASIQVIAPERRNSKSIYFPRVVMEGIQNGSHRSSSIHLVVKDTFPTTF